MAKTNNKYTSINFNDIYDKSSSSSNTSPAATKPISSAASATSYSSTTSTLYKSHLQNNGRMLVLTRPTPKPVTLPTQQQPQPQPQPQPPQTQPTATQGSGSEPVSDPISLRPLGRTGAGPCVSSPVQEVLSSAVSVKTGKFVPPHLRPGFVAKEEKPGPEVNRGPVHRNQQQQQGPGGYSYGSPGRYGENGRPRSGGYDRVRRGVGEADLGRPSSSGNRPSSSGWY